MRTVRSMSLPLTLLIAPLAAAQAPAPGVPASEAQPATAATLAPASAAPGADAAGATEPLDGAGFAPRAEASADPDPTIDSGLDSVAAARRTGFTAGLRLGFGVPLGKVGQDPLSGRDRNLDALSEWRVPVWIDLGYSLSGSTTLGIYAQVGSGGNGSSCIGDCDWSDIRLGAEAEWRLSPGAPIDPWLGIGLGYEWLAFRQLVSASVPDGMGGTTTAQGRVTERVGGPELMLQGGVDFQVEDALRIGPYASATVSQYLTDSYSCQPATALCPADGSIDGAALHSWIGVGLRGAYTP
jgi:hypothetical protein